MSSIIFRAPASVWEHPADGSECCIEDAKVLKKYNGYVYKDECFDEHMSGKNDRELEDAGVSGGYLRFEYRENVNLL